MKMFLKVSAAVALLFPLSALAAFPSTPEYNGTLGTTPISVMNNQNAQVQAETLFLQTGHTNTPSGDWQVFATGIYSPITVDGDNNTQPGYNQNNAAFTVGTDYHFSKTGLYGVSAGRAMNNVTYKYGNGSYTLDENLLSIFAGYSACNVYGDAIASYGNIDNSNISHNIGSQNLTGQTTGQQYAANGTLGYNFVLMNNNLRTGPVLTADYQNIMAYAYTETANNSGPLTTLQYNQQDNDSLISGAGWQINYATQYNTTQLIPFLQTTYDHQFFNQNRNISVGTVVNSTTTMNSLPYSTPDSDFVNVSTGVQSIFQSGLDLTFGYNAALGQSNASAQSFMISASMPVM